MNATARKLAVTLGVLVALWAIANVDVLPSQRTLFDPNQTMSMMHIGIRPLVAGFMLVELVALIIPSLRRRRVAGRDARRPLRIAGWVISALVALVQLFGASRAVSDALEGPGATVALLTLGLALSWAGWLVVDRFGLGSGYLVASLLVRDLWRTLTTFGHQLEADLIAPGALLLAVGAAAGGVAFLLARIRRPIIEGKEQLVAPIPISGLGMSASAGALLSFPATLASFRVPGADSLSRLVQSSQLVYLTASVVIGAGFTLLWGLIFFRPKAVASVWKEWNPSFDATSLELSARALVPPALRDALIINVPIAALFMYLRVPSEGLVLSLLPLALGVRDVLDEWNAGRRHGALVPVWELHRVYEVDAVLRRLEAEGLHPLAKSRHLRAAFQVFAPFIPIVVMVPEVEAARANEVIASRLRPAA